MLWMSFFYFVLAAAVIFSAAHFLTRCADSLAVHTGWGRLLVGSLLLAGATSLPEFFVDLSAIRQGLPDMAVGDLLGSSLFNLLILALADLFQRGAPRVFVRSSSHHAMAAALSLLVTTVAGLGIFLGQDLAPYAIGEFGIGTLSLVLVYLLGIRWVFFDQQAQQAETTAQPQAEREKPPQDTLPLTHAVGGFLAAAILILVAAPFMTRAAEDIATQTGLGTTFVGTVLLAFCTSLPELVATFTAVRRGAVDLALGNIFGSNTFNLMLLAPLDLVHPGPLLASVSKVHLITCLSVILITTVALMGQLYRVEKRKNLIEPGALLVVILALGSFWLISRFAVV